VPATTGYTNTQFQDDNSGHVGSSSDYKIVAATGTQDAAWGTLAAASSWTSKMITLKAPAGAAPGQSAVSPMPFYNTVFIQE
jgi:hypothetical protein